MAYPFAISQGLLAAMALLTDSTILALITQDDGPEGLILYRTWPSK